MILDFVDSLNKKFTETKNYSNFLQTQIKDKERQLEKHHIDYTNTLGTLELDKKVAEVVKEVTEKFAAGGFQFLQDLVTRGLQTIFTDDSYKFVIEMDERGNSKTVEFFIFNSSGVKTPITDCGGGIQVVVSFIVRVYMIMKLNLMRFIVLDEYFSQLSIQYAEGLLSFLESMVTELNFDILWISHNRFFADRAQRVYEVSKGKLTLMTGG